LLHFLQTVREKEYRNKVYMERLIKWDGIQEQLTNLPLILVLKDIE
jgi:hypothetical protein